MPDRKDSIPNLSRRRFMRTTVLAGTALGLDPAAPGAAAASAAATPPEEDQEARQVVHGESGPKTIGSCCRTSATRCCACPGRPVRKAWWKAPSDR